MFRKRKAPEGIKTPVLQEDSLLSFLEAERIKEINAFRLWKWIIANPSAESWGDVPWEDLELPKRMRELVPRHFVLHSSKIAERFDSADGTTTKLLVELHDGEQVEAVVMRHDTRATLCVSSQVGCQMGCTFCATGTMGLRGNLSSGEILEQLLHAGSVEPIRNVVFMGMGEPLHNYASVLSALKAMTDVRRWSLRHGHITVSTVGVISNMKKLTADMPNVSLALSLHAPTQAVREVIVPTAKAHPLPDLLAALDRHLATCKKKTVGAVAGMIEYILIAGVNDSMECADQLGALLAPRNVMLNLIPYNDTTAVIVNKAFVAPTASAVDAFQAAVVRHGVLTRVRREMGADIAGACGQLALSNGGGGDDKQKALSANKENDRRAAAAAAAAPVAGAGGGCSSGGAKGESGGGGLPVHSAAAAASGGPMVADIEDFGRTPRQRTRQQQQKQQQQAPRPPRMKKKKGGSSSSSSKKESNEGAADNPSASPPANNPPRSTPGGGAGGAAADAKASTPAKASAGSSSGSGESGNDAHSKGDEEATETPAAVAGSVRSSQQSRRALSPAAAAAAANVLGAAGLWPPGASSARVALAALVGATFVAAAYAWALGLWPKTWLARVGSWGLPLGSSWGRRRRAGR